MTRTSAFAMEPYVTAPSDFLSVLYIAFVYYKEGYGHGKEVPKKPLVGLSSETFPVQRGKRKFVT